MDIIKNVAKASLFEEKEEQCVHGYQYIGNVDVDDGIGFVFYCNKCLDIQIRGLKSENKKK